MLQSIIIADSTTAKWRGLIIGIVNLPYLVNFAVAGPLVELVMRTQGWRFGFGMWTVILPIAALPLLATLFVGQKRARRAGLLTTNPIRARSFGAAIIELAITSAQVKSWNDNVRSGPVMRPNFAHSESEVHR